MNLCSRNHDEICFENNICPFCEYIKSHDKEMDEKDAVLNEANSTLETVTFELKEMTEELENVKNLYETAKKDLQLTRDGQRDGQL